MTERKISGSIARSAEDIEAFVDAQQSRLLDLCSDLVAARSVNPPGRTVEAAAIVEAFLNENDIVCETLASVSDKPNLMSQADGTESGPHLILNGHLDTVSPGREEDWSVPLFETRLSDGKMTGLGMGNMKAGVAALSMAFVWLVRNSDTWPGKVSLTIVADETVFGPDGAGWLLGQRPDLKGDSVICGEGPGDMNLAIAEKGLLWVELMATAPSGQGMLSQIESSAVTRLASAICEIDAWNDTQVAPPEEIRDVGQHAGEHGQRLSVNAGTIGGGDFVSQVATNAVAEIDFRIPPGMSTGEIENRLSELCARKTGVTWRRIKGWEPNWTAPGEPIAASLARSAKLVTGVSPNPVVRLPASDASRWRALRIPAICFGPQPLLASGVDDFAFTKDILDCTRIYALTAATYLHSDPL